MTQTCLSCGFELSQDPQDPNFHVGGRICLTCMASTGDRKCVQQLMQIKKRITDKIIEETLRDKKLKMEQIFLERVGARLQEAHRKQVDPPLETEIIENPTNNVVLECDHDWLPTLSISVLDIQKARIYKLGSPGEYDIGVCLICDSILRRRTR